MGEGGRGGGTGYLQALQTLVGGQAHLSPENNGEALKDLGAGEEGRSDHSM